MRISLFDFDLPPSLIAKEPPKERDGARLVVLSDKPTLASVRDLPRLLPEGALVVVNDTRVRAARLFGAKPSGGRVELLLLVEIASVRFVAIGRASKGLRAGTTIRIDARDGVPAPLFARVDSVADDGSLTVSFRTDDGTQSLEWLERCGHIPLPPYIDRPATLADDDRYQTVFAKQEKHSVAAPTAGLHLSSRILEEFGQRQIEIACVTLHVGLGTFRPVAALDYDDHAMHEEVFRVPSETVSAVARARARGAPVVAIGTTVVRALESAVSGGELHAKTGRTRLLIQPGHRFTVPDWLFTNFHLPKSTLLALVAAFGGRERVLEAYRFAVRERLRFFSYGDAMLLKRMETS